MNTEPDYKSLAAQYAAEREHNANMAGMHKACAEKMKTALVDAEEAMRRDTIAQDWDRGSCRDDEEFERENLWGSEVYKAREALAEYARCSSEQPATGWRDISTAPVGEYVLLLIRGPHNGSDAPDVVVGMKTPDGDFWLTSIWAGSCSYKPPTHWQPLPPAPQAVKGEQQG